MEDEVIYNAKIYAKKKEESLSSLVENYLKAVSVEAKDEKNKTLFDCETTNPFIFLFVNKRNVQ